MPRLIEPSPVSPVEAVTEVWHGVPVSDPYRWLENQESPRTREWLATQTRYARSYLDSIPGREQIRERIRQLLDVETYDSVQQVGGRFVFRKRGVGQEQFSICQRTGSHGRDEILVDPALRGNGPHTAVRPLRVSPDGRLLLYEVKQGGERSGRFELLDTETRQMLPDGLPRGYLRGFEFASDSRAFYYIHQALESKNPHYCAAYQHVLGNSISEDKEIFFAGEDPSVRLHMVRGKEHLGFSVVRFEQSTLMDFYLWPFSGMEAPELVIRNASYMLQPWLLDDGRILAVTDREAPNLKIVAIERRKGLDAQFIDIVPSQDFAIQSWLVGRKMIFVSYLRNLQTEIDIFDLSGKQLDHVPLNKWDTARILPSSEREDELLFEQESFTKPAQISTYQPHTRAVSVWAERRVPFESESFAHTQVRFLARDGTEIPMFLVGRREVLDRSTSHPTLMTSYGGYGVAMTPQFSVFVAFLIERGCLFALPNIRGGSEFGAAWHRAATRRSRQVAFDDFIAAAEWLIETGRTRAEKLAIFGGSNSGLLVGAAMTQRPDLFRAVIAMVPMLDMVRYHLFDHAHVWRDELGTADDPEDFAALLGYSPYHNVRDNTAYPAVMIVSGDSDQNCNPLHARKMTARLQAANVSGRPIFLDYSRYRGHSPVLPLSERVEALTDRMAFLCDQLQLAV